jgi:hypothetical protein
MSIGYKEIDMERVTRSKEFLEVINKKPAGYIRWGGLIVPIGLLAFIIAIANAKHTPSFVAALIAFDPETASLRFVIKPDASAIGLAGGDEVLVFCRCDPENIDEESFFFKANIETIIPNSNDKMLEVTLSQSSILPFNASRIRGFHCKVEGMPKSYFNILFLNTIVLKIWRV